MTFDFSIFGRSVRDDWQIEGSKAMRTIDQFGGPAANVAVHLTNLGLKCTLVTSLGTDSFSILYREYLSDIGVDLKYCQKLDRPLARCKIWPGVKYEWVDDYDGHFSLDNLQIKGALSSSKAAYFSDLPPSSLCNVSHSKIVYYSPQHSLLEPEFTRFLDNFGNVKVIFMNQQEADRYERAYKLSIEEMSRLIPKLRILVTRQALPTICYIGGIKSEHVIHHSELRNSIGGGDAFAAGFCAADFLGFVSSDSIDFGHSCASIVVQKTGCQTDYDAFDEPRGILRKFSEIGK